MLEGSFSYIYPRENLDDDDGDVIVDRSSTLLGKALDRLYKQKESV